MLVAGALAACLLGAVLTFVGSAVGCPEGRGGGSDCDRGMGPLAKPGSDVTALRRHPASPGGRSAGHEAYGSPNYPAPPEAYPLFREHRPLEPGTKLGLIFTNNVLGVGTMNAVVVAVNTLRAMGTSYQILPERWRRFRRCVDGTRSCSARR